MDTISEAKDILPAKLASKLAFLLTTLMKLFNIAKGSKIYENEDPLH